MQTLSYQCQRSQYPEELQLTLLPLHDNRASDYPVHPDRLDWGVDQGHDLHG